VQLREIAVEYVQRHRVVLLIVSGPTGHRQHAIGFPPGSRKADYKCKTLDRPGPYTRELSRSRCEVPVRIPWILCVTSISLKTRGLRIRRGPIGKNSGTHVPDTNAELLYIMAGARYFRYPDEPDPVNEIFPVIPP